MQGDAQSYMYGSRCMALGHAFGVRYSWADAQSYGSRCMALGHAFGVCVYAG